jgi:hypothetical protein
MFLMISYILLLVSTSKCDGLVAGAGSDAQISEALKGGLLIRGFGAQPAHMHAWVDIYLHAYSLGFSYR